MNWRPLSTRGKDDPRFDSPSEGLPAWLKGPVLQWVQGSFREAGTIAEQTNALDALQLAFRLEAPLTGQAAERRNDLIRRMRQDDEFALDVLDWMLHHWNLFVAPWTSAGWSNTLNNLLRQGGSAWEVTAVDDFASQLTRRAVGPVVEVLEQTATDAARAHAHLASAWSKLTGRNPDPSGVYREAIRAVEAVAKPIILPKDNLATMGLMIAALRDKPEKWTTTLGRVDDIRAQMEAVHRGQLDRHGTDDESVPLNVSPEEADAAFSTCLNLTRWFVGHHVASTE
jgi:hypothetical protein